MVKAICNSCGFNLLEWAVKYSKKCPGCKGELKGNMSSPKKPAKPDLFWEWTKLRKLGKRISWEKFREKNAKKSRPHI